MRYPWKEETKNFPCLADAILDRLKFHGGMLVQDLMTGFKRSEKAMKRHLMVLIRTNKVIGKLPLTKESHIRFVYPVEQQSVKEEGCHPQL